MSRRLLILDDDPTIGAMLAMIGESAGLETDYTTTPDDFFRNLAHKCPDFIALDLVMPEMDGVQVMAHLAQRRCSAAIIITSGVGNRVLDAAQRSAMEHGLRIVGALSKPFTPSAFRELLTVSSSEMLPGSGGGVQGLARSPRTDSEIRAADLARGLEAQELFLVYQPQVNCADGALSGFEALVRWRHPERGIVMPDEFLPVAEDAHLIDSVTDQVVDLGLAWLAATFAAADGAGPEKDGEVFASGITLSLNVSAASLENRDFVRDLVAACEHHRVSPGRVILELTETTTMRDPVATLDQLTRMRMKGFQLSIDDFGTGFSSMLQLARLPFSEIKIDKSFVMGAMQSAESRAVVRSVIELGKSFGLRTVAEGVEDAATLGYLRERGCQVAQGYHMARPMPAEDIPAWMQARHLRPEPAEHDTSSRRTDRSLETFHWDQDFVTGLDDIDHQHKHIVDLVNEFGQALMEGNAVADDELERLFSELVDYTHYHFKAEEDLMTAAGLDTGYVEFHRGEHEAFAAELWHMRETADPARPESLQPALRFLINWLAYHILGVDQGMARQVAAIREGVSAREAVERERPDAGGNRQPVIEALTALFALLSQRNREWREAHRALEEKLLRQGEALAQAHRQLEAKRMGRN